MISSKQLSPHIENTFLEITYKKNIHRELLANKAHLLHPNNYNIIPNNKAFNGIVILWIALKGIFGFQQTAPIRYIERFMYRYNILYISDMLFKFKLNVKYYACGVHRYSLLPQYSLYILIIWLIKYFNSETHNFFFPLLNKVWSDSEVAK